MDADSPAQGVKFARRNTFWQSLGRARGEIDANWPNGEMRCQNKLGRCDARYCEYGGYKNPKDRALQFFEWIMDAKDAESFFGDIVAA